METIYVMKTNSLRSVLFAGAALAAVGFATSNARAGAEPEHARNQHKTRNTPALTIAERSQPSWTDARLAAVTETRSSLPNGRGTQVTSEVSKKLECTSCDTPMIAMKPSGHNGRGAMAPVEIRGRHDCTKDGCGTAVAVPN